jgi:coproporphyrinogen III oxidase-like Fe-S oxidoreductase
MKMMDPFELVFSNIMFYYPAFRPVDAARENYGRLRETLDAAVGGGALGKRGLMIYLHIPYCRRICRFCGYHRRRLTRPEALSAYVDRLLAEIRQWSLALDGPRRPVSLLYFGGGTPTLLPGPDFLRLVAALKNAFAVSDATEFDMESDAAALQDPGNLKLYRMAGVKRISFGVQSFDAQVRRTAGLAHGRGSGSLDRSIDCLRQAGYGINYDLMFGLPGQSADSFLQDIRRSAFDIAADHVDLLEFFPQPQAYFTRHFEEFKHSIADRDTRRRMYRDARGFLLQNGFVQHTLTDFWRARLAPSAFKTMLYRNADILGLGAGSHGVLADCAYRNARLDEGYLTPPSSSLPLAFIRHLPLPLRRTRSLVLLPKLLSFSERDFPEGAGRRERAILQRFVEQGRLERRKDGYVVTEAGMLNSGDMLLDVLRAEGA